MLEHRGVIILKEMQMVRRYFPDQSLNNMMEVTENIQSRHKDF